MSGDLERDLDNRWHSFVNQIRKVEPAHLILDKSAVTFSGGIVNRCSLEELFLTFVLFISVIYLIYLIRTLAGQEVDISSIETQIANKIIKDVAILFLPTSEKAIRRQVKFVIRTTPTSSIPISNRYLDAISLQSYMFLFAQIKPLQQLLFFFCALFQYFAYKSVSQKQIDELIYFTIGKIGKKTLSIQSLKPIQSTTDLIFQAETLTDRNFLQELRRMGILPQNSLGFV